VASQSGNGEYEVIKTERDWMCSCPDHIFRNVKCKHIWAVEFSLTLRREVSRQVVIKPINVQLCPDCHSDQIVKRGYVIINREIFNVSHVNLAGNGLSLI